MACSSFFFLVDDVQHFFVCVFAFEGLLLEELLGELLVVLILRDCFLEDLFLKDCSKNLL